MALPKLFLVCIILVIAMLNESQAGVISVYWGRNVGEKDLSTTCKSKNYDIVNIAYLQGFGNGTELMLNLTGHCNPASNGCTGLSREIKECQELGVKVFLSIGGDYGDYSLRSTEDARNVAKDIWNNFLSGQSPSHPLGDAVLDGIDFDIQKGRRVDLFYAEMALALRKLSASARGDENKLLLSAATGCSLDDYMPFYFALRFVRFDYLSIKFYNNQECDFSNSDHHSLLIGWDKWRDEVAAKELLFGVPPESKAVNSGYIAPGTLAHNIIPKLKDLPNFGGVMISSRYHDLISSYTRDIKSCVQDPSTCLDSYSIASEDCSSTSRDTCSA